MRRIKANIGGAGVMLAIIAHSGVAQSDARSMTRTLLFGGATDTRVDMTRIADLAVAADGHMFIAQPLTREIQVFDDRGAPVHTIGRRGDGPGEFQSISRIGLLRDTLWVFDVAQRRLTMLGFSGVPHELVRFKPAPHRLAVRPVGLLSGGSVLEVGALNSNDLASSETRDVPVMLTDRQGNTHRHVATISAEKFTLLIPLPGGRHRTVWPSLITEAFGDDPLVRVASNGIGFLIVRRPAPSGPEESKFEIVKYGGDGTAEWTRGVRYEPVPVRRLQADSLVRRLIEWQVTSHDVPSRGTSESAIKDGLAIPRFYPPVSDAVLGRDGSIWLRGPWMGEPNVVWTVLDSRGDPIDRLILPRSITVLEAEQGTIWGTTADADNVPQVVRYSAVP